MDLLLIHLVALVWLSVAAAWRWTGRGADLVLAAAGIAWANLLATLLILSLVGHATSSSLCLGVSVSIGSAIAGLAWRYPVAESPSVTEGTSPLWRIGALFFLAALAAASAAAGAAFAPFAPTALEEALPNTFLLLGRTGLLPHDAAGVAETLFTLNRNALHVWALMYHPGLATLSFVNWAGWAVTGVAVYRASTLVGTGTNAALFATICALSALPVLAQAATLDHHLWAGSALLTAACFAVEYLRNERRSSAAFAGLFAGLAAGSSVGALALVLLSVAWLALDQRARTRAPWLLIGPGLVFGLLPLFINTALALAFHFSTFVTALPHSLRSTDFIAGASFAGGPIAPTELSVGPGLSGIICLAAALVALLRRRALHEPATLLALGALLWLGGAAAATLWHPFDAREWVPALILAGPSVAVAVTRTKVPRLVAWLAGAVLLAVVAWSTQGYLWRNAWRPLGSWWDRSIALRLPSELARSLEYHLAQGTGLRLITVAQVNAPADPARGDSLLVFPFSATARQRVLAELDDGPSYVLLPYRQKTTVGVEYLGRAHLGVDARDYFGIPDRPGSAVDDRNSNLLIIVSQEDIPARARRLQIELMGLNPADPAKLEIVAENQTGQRTTVAVLAASGRLSLEKPAELRRLHFRLSGTDDGAEKGIAALDDRRADEFIRPADNDPLRIMGVELVSRAAPAPIQVDPRLLAPDGPFPQWNLPLTRAMRAEAIRLSVPGRPGLATLRVSLSARLQNRPQGIMAIVCNGAELRRVAFDESMTWQQVAVEAPARPGMNIIELRDLPLPPSPDWSAYLQRYPDVRLHLELTHQPPIEGARVHYESCGRAEGRTVVLVDQPRPAPDALYYLFRSLRVEGLRP